MEAFLFSLACYSAQYESPGNAQVQADSGLIILQAMAFFEKRAANSVLKIIGNDAVFKFEWLGLCSLIYFLLIQSHCWRRCTDAAKLAANWLRKSAIRLIVEVLLTGVQCICAGVRVIIFNYLLTG